MDKRPIGVFDSGVGGLSVVKSILEVLPNEEIIYFGDTKRAPYGIRSKKEITEFSIQIINFLLEKNCKAIVIACNTICVSCFEELKNKFDVPIIEVISPAVTEAIKITKKGVGIFATKATINSEAHKKAINIVKPNLPVHAVICTDIVDIVEKGLGDTLIARETTKKYFLELDNVEIDSLILGCTHFPLIKNLIQEIAGDNIHIIDPALGTANQVKTTLELNNLLNENKSPKHKFFYSGDEKRFSKILKDILPNIVTELKNTQKVF